MIIGVTCIRAKLYSMYLSCNHGQNHSNLDFRFLISLLFHVIDQARYFVVSFSLDTIHSDLRLRTSVIMLYLT